MGPGHEIPMRNSRKGTGSFIQSMVKHVVLFKPPLVFAIFMLVYALGCTSFAYALEPGWKMVSAPPVSPDEARQTLAECEGLVTTSHQLRGMATSETEATPEINDWDQASLFIALMRARVHGQLHSGGCVVHRGRCGKLVGCG